MAEEVFTGRKDPGGFETCYLLLQVLEDAGIERQVSQDCVTVPSALHGPLGS